MTSESQNSSKTHNPVTSDSQSSRGSNGCAIWSTHRPRGVYGCLTTGLFGFSVRFVLPAEFGESEERGSQHFVEQVMIFT